MCFPNIPTNTWYIEHLCLLCILSVHSLKLHHLQLNTSQHNFRPRDRQNIQNKGQCTTRRLYSQSNSYYHMYCPSNLQHNSNSFQICHNLPSNFQDKCFGSFLPKVKIDIFCSCHCLYHIQYNSDCISVGIQHPNILYNICGSYLNICHIRSYSGK